MANITPAQPPKQLLPTIPDALCGLRLHLAALDGVRTVVRTIQASVDSLNGRVKGV